jgi:hypothetical protein
VLATLFADAASHIGGVGAVLEVVPPGCHQCGFELLRPFLIGLGEPPHLVRGQAEITERLAKRLTSVDRIKELPPYLDR